MIDKTVSDINNKEMEILLAAEQEFLEKGYSGARTVSIAERAGVTHAMLHYYFRSKELLFERVLDSKIELLANSVIVSLDSGNGEKTVLERVEDFVRRHYQFVSENSKLPLFVINEIVGDEERMELLKAKIGSKILGMVGLYQAQLDQAVKNGEICAINILTLVTDIAAMNLFSVMAKPVFEHILKMGDEGYDKWRCEENVTVIKKRLMI